MKMTWMTRMINDQAERKKRMINGTWVDEEDENGEYVDDELSMMSMWMVSTIKSMWRMSMSMTKKMTKRTCESSD